MSELWPTVVALLLHLVVAGLARQTLRPVVLVLWISSFYYSYMGPWYWLTVHGGKFLGVYWGDEIPRASTYISIAALGFAVSIVALDQLWSRISAGPKFHGTTEPPVNGDFWRNSERRWRIFFRLGVVSGLFVMGRILKAGGSADGFGGFDLIAYQFSDLLIPVLVFLIGARGMDRVSVTFLALFCVYASILGFRYKLILVFFPMMVMYVFPAHGKRRVSVATAALMLALVIGGFSVLTVTRTKFSGVDLQALSSASGDDLTYGLFAESNTIFGLIAVLHRSIDGESYIHLAPLRDALLELVPRILLPDRVTGTYLGIAMEYLLADEAMGSGTAFPYVGELLLMDGVLSLFIGTLVLATVVVTLARFFERLPDALMGVKNAGHGMLAAYFGYYYFSRGYLPQTFKAFLFVVLPLVLISAAAASPNRPHFLDKN